MSEKCPTCGFLFCDGHAPPKIEQPKPRRISNARTVEIETLLSELKSGKISHAEALRLYKDIQAAMKTEIKLLRDVQTEIYLREAETLAQDFPVK